MRTIQHRLASTSILALVLAMLAAAASAAPDAAQDSQKRDTMATHAKGTFDVKLAPDGPDDKVTGTTMGRMSIDKTFQGDLVGTSKGQMLTGMTEVKGSAGYVAIERVTGTIAGRQGTFLLQHNGLMDQGKPRLEITIVPDSGTGQLAGIGGTMTIDIKDGKHFYDLAYTLRK